MNIEISGEDLRRLLSDNGQMRQQITDLQNRGSQFLLENRDLKKEIEKLHDAIRKHRDASGHNLCWYCPELWDLLPDKRTSLPVIPPVDEFLDCCRAYRASLEKVG